MVLFPEANWLISVGSLNIFAKYVLNYCFMPILHGKSQQQKMRAWKCTPCLSTVPRPLRAVTGAQHLEGNFDGMTYINLMGESKATPAMSNSDQKKIDRRKLRIMKRCDYTVAVLCNPSGWKMGEANAGARRAFHSVRLTGRAG